MGAIIAGMMSGAGEGMLRTGEHVSKSILAEEAAKVQAMRDERLAELARETHAVNARTDIGLIGEKAAAELPGKTAIAKMEGDVKVDTARRSPRTMTAGSSEFQDGGIIATAPEKPTPREQLDYYRASANRLNAEAAAIRDGVKYRDKAEKPPIPKIKVETLERDGVKTIVNVDENSGAIGIVTPGEPATAGKTHWFSPDEPGKPEGAPNITWSHNGRVLPGGLSDLYPAMKERIGTQGQTATQPPQSTSRPPIDSFFGQRKTPPAASATAPARPAARDQREYDPALENTDQELRRLGNLARMPGIDPNVSTNAFIDYADRLKQLRAVR